MLIWYYSGKDALWQVPCPFSCPEFCAVNEERANEQADICNVIYCGEGVRGGCLAAPFQRRH